jgi:chromosome segregation ATPase
VARTIYDQIVQINDAVDRIERRLVDRKTVEQSLERIADLEHALGARTYEARKLAERVTELEYELSEAETAASTIDDDIERAAEIERTNDDLVRAVERLEREVAAIGAVRDRAVGESVDRGVKLEEAREKIERLEREVAARAAEVERLREDRDRAPNAAHSWILVTSRDPSRPPTEVARFADREAATRAFEAALRTDASVELAAVVNRSAQDFPG